MYTRSFPPNDRNFQPDHNAAGTPKVFGRDGRVGFGDQSVVDLLQALQRQAGPGLAVGTIRVGRWTAALKAAQGLGLADGLTAGGAGLGDLPKERPEGQAEVPTPVAGVGAFILLGQAPGEDPGTEEQFHLVEVRAQGGAEAVELGGEVTRPGWEVRCHRMQWL
jgi:hypothetical protein